MARDRKSDVQFQIHRLERKHTELAARVAELESHMYLPPHEQVLVSALKKRKLAAKDAIADLKRDN
jgi:hypothetical protein